MSDASPFDDEAWRHNAVPFAQRQVFQDFVEPASEFTHARPVVLGPAKVGHAVSVGQEVRRSVLHAESLVDPDERHFAEQVQAEGSVSIVAGSEPNSAR